GQVKRLSRAPRAAVCGGVRTWPSRVLRSPPISFTFVTAVPFLVAGGPRVGSQGPPACEWSCAGRVSPGSYRTDVGQCPRTPSLRRRTVTPPRTQRQARTHQGTDPRP